MELDLYKTINPIQNEVQYDPDSSPEAWNLYLKLYKNHWLLFKEFDLENFKYSGSKYKRLLAVISKESMYAKEGELWPKFKIGGDACFNFNNDKITKFKKIINDDVEANELLQRCATYHHTILNFAIMPVSGRMQFTKNLGVGDNLDRLDSLAFMLNEYYIFKEKYFEKRQVLMLNH